MRAPTLLRVLAVAAGAALVLGACDDSGSSADRSSTSSTSRRRTTTTTTTDAASSTTTTVPPTTVPPTVPPTTVPPGPPSGSLPCGERGGPISAAVLGGGLGPVPVENYTLTDCRIAAANEIWAAVTLAPKPGTTVPRLTVALERIGSIWTVRAYGERSVACDAPPPVPQQLGLGC
jgi:hypothetical protein